MNKHIKLCAHPICIEARKESKKGESWRRGYQQGREEVLEEVERRLPSKWNVGLNQSYKNGFNDCLSTVKNIINEMKK